MQLHRNSIQQLPWSAETVYLNFPKKVSRRAWNLPTLIGRSKTPPRPLREALRIRMEKPGEESGDLFGRPRALGRCGGPTFCSSNKPRKACFPSIPIPISINLHLRPSAAICGSDLSTASSEASDVLCLAHSKPRHAFLRYRYRFRFR